MTRTTIVHAPHPDDDMLYVGTYVANAAARGDRLVLIAWTDGGSSGMKPAAWSVEELCAIRRLEQEACWRTLTGGKGIIRRMGCIDSKDPDLRAKVHGQAELLEAEFSEYGDVEHYAACNDGRGQGVDHDAVALGLRDALVRVKRFANRCTDTNGTVYRPADLSLLQKADTAYRAFGHDSVASFWKALRDSGYTNRITV